jgi:hypothetical protein
LLIHYTAASGVDNKGTRFAEAKNILITKVVSRIFALTSQRGVKSEYIAQRGKLL